MHFAKALWSTLPPLRFRSSFGKRPRIDFPRPLNLQKRYGPRNFSCAPRGAPEDVDHIPFQCAPAKFCWSCVWESVGCTWVPKLSWEILSFCLIPEVNNVESFGARLRQWLGLHNKLTMKGFIPHNLTDYIFKWSILFHPDRPLRKEEWQRGGGVKQD